MKTIKPVYRSNLLFCIALSFLMLGAAKGQDSSGQNPGSEEPGYKKEKAAEIINKMVEAHGGMAKWLHAPSLRFTHIAHMFALPVGNGRSYYDNWRYYQVTVEPRTSRGYVVLPLEEDARIAVAEKRIWSSGYDENGPYKSSPLVVMYYQYAFLNLPWLTQMPGVNLEYLGKEILPQDSTSYHAVKMTFAPETGKEHRGYYILYINTESYLLKATKHTALFPILPGRAMERDVPVFPDSYYRVFNNYVTSAGLRIPTSYESYSADAKRLLSIHLIIDPSFEERFDEEMLNDLKNAMVKF